MNSDGIVPLPGARHGGLWDPWDWLAVFPQVEELVCLAVGRVETVLTELSSLRWHCPNIIANSYMG